MRFPFDRQLHGRRRAQSRRKTGWLAILLTLGVIQNAHSQTIGDPAPELGVQHWANDFGQAPTLERLRGHPVLIAPFVRSSTQKLVETHEEYARSGLVILALTSREAEKESDPGSEDLGYALPYPIGYGTKVLQELNGGRRTVGEWTLIDREGRIAWHGYPSGLSSRPLKAALRGAPKRDERWPLGWRGGDKNVDPKVLELAAQGRLSDAFRRLADDDPFRKILYDHVEGITDRVQAAIEARVGLWRALKTLRLLVDELDGSTVGRRARGLLAEVEEDAGLLQEEAAYQSLLKWIDFDVWRGYGGTSDRNGSLISKKAYPPIARTKRKQLASLIKRYPGTQAATRAEKMLAQLGR